jgi:hypothetical protein
VEVPLSKYALTAAKFVDVLLSKTEDEANMFPLSVKVLLDDLYSCTSPNEIPPFGKVDSDKEIADSGVEVPIPR